MTIRPANQHNYGALEQRVYNVEQSLAGINDGILALSAKIDERSRTSWPTLASFATVLVVVMGGMGTLALRPGAEAIERLNRQINAVDAYNLAQSIATIDRQQRRIDDFEKESRLRSPR